MFNKRSRFTLIELIVVIAVLGILSSIVIPNIKDVGDKAEVSAVKSNIRNIQTAVDMFYLDYDYYPCDNQPKLIEEKDKSKNPINTSFSQEVINFEKDNFVTDYLRENPKNKSNYYLDYNGIVHYKEDFEEKPIITEYFLESGDQHSLFLNNKGEIYAWGRNQYKQVLNTNEEYIKDPMQIDFFVDKDIVQIATSFYTSMALTKTGEVYGWGFNSAGELGLGHSNQVNEPTKLSIPDDKKVKKIAMGVYSSYIVTEDNLLYVSGNNSYGQLGLGHKEKIVSFTENTNINSKKIKDIKASSHVILLTEDNELYAWGRNQYNQIGIPNLEYNITTPIQITTFEEKVKDFSVGEEHSLVLLENGEVYSSGENYNYQLGLGHSNEVSKFEKVPLSKDLVISKVSAGYDQSHILTNKGEVYGVGHGLFGEVGLGNSDVVLGFTKLDTLPDSIFSNVELQSGFSFFITKDGNVFACGKNPYGQLGLGNELFGKTVFDPQQITIYK